MAAMLSSVILRYNRLCLVGMRYGSYVMFTLDTFSRVILGQFRSVKLCFDKVWSDKI